MIYFEILKTTEFTATELKKASAIIKNEFPNGPKVNRMEIKKFSFNEIANHIHTSYQEVSKSLYS